MLEGLICKTDKELSDLLRELLGLARDRNGLLVVAKEECGEFLCDMRTKEVGDHLAQAALESAFCRIKSGRMSLQ